MCFKCVLEYVSDIAPSQLLEVLNKNYLPFCGDSSGKISLLGFHMNFFSRAMRTPAQNDLEHVLTTTIAVYLG